MQLQSPVGVVCIVVTDMKVIWPLLYNIGSNYGESHEVPIVSLFWASI